MKKNLAAGMVLLGISVALSGCGSAGKQNTQALAGIGNAFCGFQENGISLSGVDNTDPEDGAVPQPGPAGETDPQSGSNVPQRQPAEESSSKEHMGNAGQTGSAAKGGSTGDNHHAENQGSSGNHSNSGSGSAGNQGNVGNPSKPEGGTAGSGASDPVVPSKSEHTHEWVEHTQIVYHEATGHYETKVVQEAVWKDVCVCLGCGHESNTAEEAGIHSIECESGQGYTVKSTKIQEEVTDQIWIEDSKAWEETIVTGSVCSGCGAVK